MGWLFGNHAEDGPDPDWDPEVDPDGLGWSGRWWTCAECGLTFIHGRYLAGHILDFHGDFR